MSLRDQLITADTDAEKAAVLDAWADNDYAKRPDVGDPSKIYMDKDTGQLYRYDSSTGAYVGLGGTGTSVTVTTLTSAAPQAAIDGIYALGGGTVYLVSGTYVVTSEITLKAGVSLVGSKPTMTITSDAPEDSFTITGGSILLGNGSTRGIVYNADDAGSPAAAFSADTLQGVSVKDIGLDGFTYGIKVGANNKAGALSCVFSGIRYINCSTWGVYFTNFQFITFEDIQGRTIVNSQNGGQYFGSTVAYSGSLLPGNSVIRNLFHTTRYRLNKGIEFDCSFSGAGMNDLIMNKVQVNRVMEFGEDLASAAISFTTSSSSITFTGGSAVANCAKFQPGMTVYFTNEPNSNSGGFAWPGAGVSFFVLTNDGNTVITLGKTRDGAAQVWGTSGTTTNTLNTGGFAGVEFKSASGQFHTNYVVNGLAVEVAPTVGAPSIVAQNMSGALIQISDLNTGAHTDLILRGSSQTVIQNTSVNPSGGISIDLDSGAASTRIDGKVGNVYGYAYGYGVREGKFLPQASSISIAAVAAGLGSTGTATVVSSYSNNGQVVLTPGGTGIAAGKVATVTALPAKTGSAVVPIAINSYVLLSQARVSSDGSDATTAVIFRAEVISTTSFAIYSDVALTSGQKYFINFLC